MAEMFPLKLLIYALLAYVPNVISEYLQSILIYQPEYFLSFHMQCKKISGLQAYPHLESLQRWQHMFQCLGDLQYTNLLLTSFELLPHAFWNREFPVAWTVL